MYSHKWTAAFAVAVLFALQPTASNAQQRIGSANTVKPEASGTVAGTLSAGSGVHSNETIKTGSSGQAGLGFIDKSNLHVGPSSSVRLDKFVYDPNKGTGTVIIDATKGAFRFSTGAQGKGNVQVKTPHGTLGIRG
jgi:trimeric autotransporter adhesin